VSDDRPIVISVVDDEKKLRQVIPEIRGMVREGLVILLDAELIPDRKRPIDRKTSSLRTATKISGPHHGPRPGRPRHLEFSATPDRSLPDISDTQVVVITLYPGRAAEESGATVTIPIERVLNSTPNVIARRSRTIFGLSVVELTFAYGTNDYFARQVALERLRDATCPMA